MRIFSRCLVVMVLLAMTVPVAWAQTAAVPTVAAMTSIDSLVAIDQLAKQIMAANPEYPDPYAVPVGVMIRVPNPGDMDTFYRTEPWQLGQMGCFWHISAFHLFGKRMMPPEPATSATPVMESTGFTFPSLPWWFLLWLALAVAGVVHLLLHERRRRLKVAAEEEERRMDYRNDPPVVVGGLSENPSEALRQVQAATTLYHEPGREVISARHGEFRSRNGRNRVALRVEHTGPNGLATADRWVNNGDLCTQVRVSTNGGEPVTEYWLQHCGNRFGEIRDGRFQMPEGWVFAPIRAVATRTVLATEAAPGAQAIPEPALAHADNPAPTNRRSHDRNRDDKFTARVVITNNGGTNPTVKQTVEVTADRYVSEMTLPDGSKITF